MLQKEARGALEAWASTPAGKTFLEFEQAQITRHLPQFLDHEKPLWLSAFKCEPSVDAFSVCSEIDEISSDRANVVIASETELPFSDQQFSLAVSSHIHEYTEDPHRYLRELARIIEPEGLLIISGYNAYNLLGLGLRHRFYHSEGSAVYPTHYLTIRRLKDWLRLLGFELEGGGYFYYLPLSRSPYVLEKLRWMERAGNRWWPRASAGFVLTARKHTPGMTPLFEKLKLRLWSPAPQPAMASTTGKYEHR